MAIIGINGSPRTHKNTGTLLQSTLDGAASKGAEVERIDLYKLNFRGCMSCFYCKLKDKKHGICAMKDDLTPLLEKLKNADAIIFATPIYFMNISSGMAALLERFMFSNYLYRQQNPSALKRMIPTGFIYTMNMTEKQGDEFGVLQYLVFYQRVAERIFGIKPKKLFAYNTYQFDDYSKYESSIFSESEKAAYRKTQFPIDTQKAFEMGCELALRK